MKSVVLATPFYNSQGFTNYISSIVATATVLTKVGIKFETLFTTGDSYIARSRNLLVQIFLNTKGYEDFDKLFFIDSDMSWDVLGLIKMVESEKDFVGAAYPMKNNWQDFSVKHFTNEDSTPVVDSDGMIDSQLVPGGFMCLSRKCLREMTNYYFDRSYIENSPKSPYNGNVPMLFENRISQGLYQGEDSTFCEKWRHLGNKVWCYPDVSFGHMGMEEHMGNYHKTLLNQPKAQL